MNNVEVSQEEVKVDKQTIKLLIVAICLLSLALIITSRKAENLGRKPIFVEIILAFGLLCLVVTLALIPLAVPGCKINKQLLKKIQIGFQVAGTILVLLALLLSALLTRNKLYFWLYTGALINIIGILILKPELKEITGALALSSFRR